MLEAFRTAHLHWQRARHARRFFSRGDGPRFCGVFSSHEQAVGAVRAPKETGYDHAEVTEVNFTRMCEVAPWDGPVLRWLEQLLPQHSAVLDAGGHMGTKFRAFRPHLPAMRGRRWTVWDVPHMVAAGAQRALVDGLSDLHFTNDLGSVDHEHDLWLTSGLLQYLDRPFPSLLSAVRHPPRTLILHKVAVTDHPSFFTLENLGYSAVPYHVRNEPAFAASLASLGYTVRDRWEIPELSHRIPHHPEVGATRSIGLVLERAAA